MKFLIFTSVLVFACKVSKVGVENKRSIIRITDTTKSILAFKSSVMQIPNDTFIIRDKNCCKNFKDSIENGILILSGSGVSIYKKINNIPKIVQQFFPDVYFFQEVGISHKSRYLHAFYKAEINSPIYQFNNLNTQSLTKSPNEIAYCFGLLYGFNGIYKDDKWPNILKVNKIQFYDSTVDSIRTNLPLNYNYELIIKSHDTLKILLSINKYKKIEGWKDITNPNRYYYERIY